MAGGPAREGKRARRVGGRGDRGALDAWGAEVARVRGTHESAAAQRDEIDTSDNFDGHLVVARPVTAIFLLQQHHLCAAERLFAAEQCAAAGEEAHGGFASQCFARHRGIQRDRAPVWGRR